MLEALIGLGRVRVGVGTRELTGRVAEVLLGLGRDLVGVGGRELITGLVFEEDLALDDELEEVLEIVEEEEGLDTVEDEVGLIEVEEEGRVVAVEFAEVLFKRLLGVDGLDEVMEDELVLSIDVLLLLLEKELE